MGTDINTATTTRVPVVVGVDATTHRLLVSAIITSGGSGGGGTEYTDGGVPPANPVGGTIEWSDGSNWQTVSTAKPLPVTATLNTAGLATSAKQDTGNTSLASIDGKITAVNTGAVVISSSALPSLAATSTKQSDGSQKTQVVDGSGNIIGSTSNALDINIKSGNPSTMSVTNAGTFAVQLPSTSTTGSAVPASATYLGGNAATALPTAATAGNLTGAMYDKFGRQVVLIDGIRDITAMQTTTISASTSETTIATAVASTFLDVTSIIISNTSATATRVDIRDTTAGSVLFSLYIPAGDVRGFVVHTPMPQTTVNTNWTAQSSASVTDLRVLVKFIRNK